MKYLMIIQLILIIILLGFMCKPFVIKLDYDSPIKIIEVYEPTPTPEETDDKNT